MRGMLSMPMCCWYERGRPGETYNVGSGQAVKIGGYTRGMESGAEAPAFKFIRMGLGLS